MFADAYRDYDSIYDAVDAVVAAVREDAYGPNFAAGKDVGVILGRQAAARDIRADPNWPGANQREHYARIAEGTDD
jgi:hypothetical protein